MMCSTLASLRDTVLCITLHDCDFAVLQQGAHTLGVMSAWLCRVTEHPVTVQFFTLLNESQVTWHKLLKAYHFWYL
jgi:hypothetical protein